MNTKISELKTELKGLTHELRGLLPDDFVDRALQGFGLQTRRSPIRGVISGTGIFLVGIIVGGAAALLLAPKSGVELRSDLEDKIDSILEKVRHIRTTKEEGAAEPVSASSTTTEKSDKDQKKEVRTPGGTMHS